MADEHVKMLKDNEGPDPRKGFSKFATWATAYARSGSLDPQALDISAEYDSALTISENKQAF